jgi:hypothetical protein
VPHFCLPLAEAGLLPLLLLLNCHPKQAGGIPAPLKSPVAPQRHFGQKFAMNESAQKQQPVEPSL